jgi:FkbM family methyltransferase
MLARLIVFLYSFISGKLGLRGGGWLVRQTLPYVPGLRAYKLAIPGVGTAILDCKDDAVLTLLNFNRNKFGTDARLLHQMDRLVRPGDVLWDVGANVGVITTYFARSQRPRAIHAFEPNPLPLRPLQSLFQNSSLVTVHPLALGDQDGEIEMKIPKRSSCTGSLAMDLEDAELITISVRRGDSLRQSLKLPAPDVMKVDVEGFEPQVFAGLAQTISENRPVIFFEHIWLTDEQVKSLAPENYSLTFILDDGQLTTDFTHRREGHDAILIPLERDQAGKMVNQ